MEPAERNDDSETTVIAEPLLLNVGPAHPAMHGTVRIVIELDGERVVRSDVQIGYPHREVIGQARQLIGSATAAVRAAYVSGRRASSRRQAWSV